MIAGFEFCGVRSDSSQINNKYYLEIDQTIKNKKKDEKIFEGKW